MDEENQGGDQSQTNQDQAQPPQPRADHERLRDVLMAIEMRVRTLMGGVEDELHKLIQDGHSIVDEIKAKL